MSGGKKQQKNRRDSIKDWRFHVLPPERLPRGTLPHQSTWSGAQLFAVCALVNLYLARKKLLLLAPA